MFEFKKQQKDIIDSQDKNLIVSASAGSGKTTVMIAKIFEMLKQGKAKISSLLVLTYTTNAAAEMKQKLISKLKEHLNEYPHLEQEMEEIDLADISTIHSFCARLIKKYFHVLQGVDPSFAVLGEEQKTLLKNKAMAQTLEQYKQNHAEDYLKLIKMYGKTRNDNKIIDIVFQIDTYLDSVLDKETYRQKTAFVLYDQPQKALDILNQNLCEKNQSFMVKMEKLLQKCQQLSSQDGTAMAVDILGALKQIQTQNNFLHNVDLLLSFKFMTKKPKVDNEELVEQIIAVRAQINALRDKLKRKNYTADMLKSFDDNRSILQQFLFLQKEYEKNYAQAKRMANGLDYSDLERLAIELTQKQEIAAELRQKYEHIFVDEFQDANQVQEKLISSIARKNNRFMVGDVKQSIYGFRRSNPQIFLDIEKAYQVDENSEAMPLNVNFRSDQNILHFVNHVFSAIMTPKTAGIDYKNNGQFEPFKALPQTACPRVKVSLIQKSKKAEKQEPTELFDILTSGEQDAETTMAQKEAILVAQDIDLLKNHYLYVDENTTRPVNYSDMAILVRKRGKYLDEFCATLASCGVPLYASSNKNMFEQGDVLKLVGLLKLTLNLYDDYSLAGVMASLLGEFSYQELASIAVAMPERKFFYEAVLNYGKHHQDELAQKIEKFLNMIQEFSLACQVKGVYLALAELLDKTQYLIKTQAFLQGEVRVATITKFVSLFKNSDFNHNVGAFLNFAENQNQLKTPREPSGETDCVTISTIHASKGLEYPIVFVVQGGVDLNRKPPAAEVKIHDSLGVGLKFYDEEQSQKSTSFVYEAINQVAEEQDFAESLRLLYVGLTRAKEYLYVYGTCDLEFEPMAQHSDIVQGKSYLDFIMGAMSPENIQTMVSNHQAQICLPNVTFETRKYDENDFEQNEQAVRMPAFSLGDDETMQKLEQSMLFTYPKPEVFSVPLKNSVSALMTEGEYESKNFAPVRLTMDEHLTEQANVLGTAYHKIFEMIDFEKADLALIEKLIQKHIEPELALQIDKQKIANAIALIRPLVSGQMVQKERKFMMKVPYNSVVESALTDHILVQGVIDLFSFGKQNVLLDYKLTTLGNDQAIRDRYEKQIFLYKKALVLAYGNMPIDCYILDINRAKLIKME